MLINMLLNMVKTTRSNTRILLVNPPFKDSRFNGAPMPLLYAAAPLLNSIREIKLLDLALPTNDLDDLSRKIQTFRPHIVGITSTSPSHLAACRVARIVKDIDPCILTIKGGIHETYCAETTQRYHPEIDIYVQGEGDFIFRTIVEKFETGDRSICGVIEASKVENLDVLPFAPRDFLEASSFYDFGIFGGRKTAQVMTVRGCPFTCRFCSSDASIRSHIVQVPALNVLSDITSSIGRRVRYRSPENVLGELQLLYHQGYRAIFFDDGTFTFNKKHAYALADALKKRRLDVVWGCQTRADHVDEELLNIMHASGCTYITFGLESISPQRLNQMERGLGTVAAVEKAVALAKKAKIPIIAVSIIFGFPDEKMEEVTATLEFVKRLDVKVSISVLALYPETRMGKENNVIGETYEQLHSQERVWENFDEGSGAVHLIDAERASTIFQTARKILGGRCFEVI